MIHIVCSLALLVCGCLDGYDNTGVVQSTRKFEQALSEEFPVGQAQEGQEGNDVLETISQEFGDILDGVQEVMQTIEGDNNNNNQTEFQRQMGLLDRVSISLDQILAAAQDAQDRNETTQIQSPPRQRRRIE